LNVLSHDVHQNLLSLVGGVVDEAELRTDVVENTLSRLDDEMVDEMDARYCGGGSKSL
jgi:hypothetical protein